MERYLNDQESLDFRAAIIASIIANVNRDPKKKPTPYKPQDFMPSRRNKTQRKNISEDQKREHYRILNASMGGREIKDGE